MRNGDVQTRLDEADDLKWPRLFAPAIWGPDHMRGDRLCQTSVMKPACPSLGARAQLRWGRRDSEGKHWPVRIPAEQDLSDRLEMRGMPLDLLRYRVDIAEPPLERAAVENRQRARRRV